MPRRGRIKKRILLADPLYSNRQVMRFVNKIMKDGKKQIAYNNIYNALDIIKKNLKTDEPVEILRQAIENVKPGMEVRSRRVGGAAYQVPMPVRGDRKEALAIRWLVLEARKRPSKEYHTFSEKLAAELIDASKNEGNAVKRKQDIHRMADSNKAFAHFRW